MNEEVNEIRYVKTVIILLLTSSILPFFSVFRAILIWYELVV